MSMNASAGGAGGRLRIALGKADGTIAVLRFFS